MQKLIVNLKSLLSNEDRKVIELVAELEASHSVAGREVWTERLSASTRGGKGGA